MNKFDTLYESVLTDLNENKSESPKITKDEAHKAAMTQRGKPESTMISVVNNLSNKGARTGIFTYYLEHLGDLAHRAQDRYGIGALKEKLNKIENDLNRPSNWLSLEKDLEEQKKSNIKFSKKDPKEVDKIEKQELKKYIEAHEKYNKPITKMGQLGKEIAIAFAKQDFPLLRKKVQALRKEVDRYDNAKPIDKEPIQYDPSDEYLKSLHK